ncbi:hypothetical protein [Flavobacterium selenitireducens]|uniref:hypothetical protein n=1 Tax=Flavobacterium selenitireducens TaxID=2722704 RepID=UPI00168ACF97|nr:hypothetical protein [Flavobacterium selenitireducens]MBD3582558.1 hypothetical protein [Flavobacterium selenitireducens]
MTLAILLLLLVLIWMTNFVFGRLFPPKAQRGVMFLFFSVLAVAVFVLMFKILKSLFVIAVPMIILLTFLVVTRKK